LGDPCHVNGALGAPAENDARQRQRRGCGATLLALGLACPLLAGTACTGQSTTPATLSDGQFWSLIESLSEPAGTFSLSENFVSNEPFFAENVRMLRPAGGVYIGVGPEQNFSYMAALRPGMAFIVDIRRENLDLHLLYKALFELATDRADFVSRLFSRPRPEGLGAGDSVQEIFSRYRDAQPSAELYMKNTALVHERLLSIRSLPLAPSDVDWIARTFKAFYDDGPEIHFWGSRSGESAPPTYRELMTGKDISGQSRSYLATEEGFLFVKDLHSRNMIVPVVGDFAGPRALAGVGDYIRKHADVVRAFYASNVKVYLTRQQMHAFCRNLASLPVGPGAWFIESKTARSFAGHMSGCPAR
jgi:hypothetical protein